MGAQRKKTTETATRRWEPSGAEVIVLEAPTNTRKTLRAPFVSLLLSLSSTPLQHSSLCSSSISLSARTLCRLVHTYSKAARFSSIHLYHLQVEFIDHCYNISIKRLHFFYCNSFFSMIISSQILHKASFFIFSCDLNFSLYYLCKIQILAWRFFILLI